MSFANAGLVSEAPRWSLIFGAGGFQVQNPSPLKIRCVCGPPFNRFVCRNGSRHGGMGRRSVYVGLVHVKSSRGQRTSNWCGAETWKRLVLAQVPFSSSELGSK
ncbi:hypothetical protein AVEN_219183-1 [Araneus ventricosus]|uniref:Uncharacterized protein n=1 Tax=Araneus ventricosus TaxID=182803 RepID=A0A4Y2HX23_ARAVE|nr:hypothetical protein AVEN_219183-1 [Araneus ventricosus]